MKKGIVFETMRRLAQRLEAEGIPYAVIGGMALAVHGYVRMTLGVDILLPPEGLARFREKLVGREYVADFPGAAKSFRDSATNIKVEIITAGEFPVDGLPKPVCFPEPEGQTIEEDGVLAINLEKLIELKLASGLSAGHRMCDLADVQDLILALKLPLELKDDWTKVFVRYTNEFGRLLTRAPNANAVLFFLKPRYWFHFFLTYQADSTTCYRFLLARGGITMSQAPQEPSFAYDAFISYSRKDIVFARVLEKALENYAPPKDLPVPQRRLVSSVTKKTLPGWSTTSR